MRSPRSRGPQPRSPAAKRTRALSDLHLPSTPDPGDPDDQPEVRLELTRAVHKCCPCIPRNRAPAVPDSDHAPPRASDSRTTQDAPPWHRRRAAPVRRTRPRAERPCIRWAQVVLNNTKSRAARLQAGPGRGIPPPLRPRPRFCRASRSSRTPWPRFRARPSDPEADAAADTAVESQRPFPEPLGYLGPDPEHGVRLLNAIVESYRGVLRDNEERGQKQKLHAEQAEIDALDLEAPRHRGSARRERRVRDRRKCGRRRDRPDDDPPRPGQPTERSPKVIALENRLATGGEQLAILDPATRSIQDALAGGSRAGMRLTYTAEHPAVESAQHQVDVLRRQLGQSSQATPDALKRDIELSRGSNGSSRPLLTWSTIDSPRSRATGVKSSRSQNSNASAR